MPNPPPVPLDYAPIPADLLDRAAARVCGLPEGVDCAQRGRAILSLLIEEGETNAIFETCIAIDARLSALCRLNGSPLLAAWVRAADNRVGNELLAAAGQAPIRAVGNGYAFDEEAFFALALAAAAARGLA